MYFRLKSTKLLMYRNMYSKELVKIFGRLSLVDNRLKKFESHLSNLTKRPSRDNTATNYEFLIYNIEDL